MAGERRLGRIIAYVILVGWTFVVGIPTYWLFITAFKRPEAINRGATYFPWVDFQPSLLAFYDVFVIQGLANSRPFVNSVVVALATATISTVIGGAGGYALARFPFRAGPLNNDRIAFGFLIQRMFPPAVLLIPFLILFRTLRLLDTREGLVLVYCAFSIPFVVWMMRDFFRSLPVEIEESALIDGCNRLGVLFRIAIPLSAPGFVTAFVLVMIGSWNEFLFALTFMFNKAVTLPLYLTLQTSIQAGTEYWNMAVIAIFSILPVAVAGLLLERYITRGLTFGAVK
ncbi:MAG: carbohydrate ABC transporter permease [Caldilineaceae bacterium]|nr:carbohydrate ABC transporter permease [Caldilineaceae bacterium]MDE0076290.1 carbohydrate ABC transporter permease [Caldilineaceae bacterium]